MLWIAWVVCGSVVLIVLLHHAILVLTDTTRYHYNTPFCYLHLVIYSVWRSWLFFPMLCCRHHKNRTLRQNFEALVAVPTARFIFALASVHANRSLIYGMTFLQRVTRFLFFRRDVLISTEQLDVSSVDCPLLNQQANANVGRMQRFVWVCRVPFAQHTLSDPTIPTSGPVVFFVHGGGYMSGNMSAYPCPFHIWTRTMAEQAKGATPCLISVDYPLAPESPAPAALDSVLRFYLFVCSRVGTNRVVLAGESAGGGLMISLCIRLQELGFPKPAALALVSPWVDFTSDRPSHTENANTDIIHAKNLRLAKTAYLSPDNSSRELALVASPLLSDKLQALPTTLVIYSKAEVFADDCAAFCDKLVAANVRCDAWTVDYEPHIFPFFFPLGCVTAGMNALAELALFCCESVPINPL